MKEWEQAAVVLKAACRCRNGKIYWRCHPSTVPIGDPLSPFVVVREIEAIPIPPFVEASIMTCTCFFYEPIWACVSPSPSAQYMISPSSCA